MRLYFVTRGEHSLHFIAANKDQLCERLRILIGETTNELLLTGEITYQQVSGPIEYDLISGAF